MPLIAFKSPEILIINFSKICLFCAMLLSDHLVALHKTLQRYFCYWLFIMSKIKLLSIKIQVLPANCVRLARNALIVSLALRSSNSRTATSPPLPPRSPPPSSEYLAVSSESKVAWLGVRSVNNRNTSNVV